MRVRAAKGPAIAAATAALLLLALPGCLSPCAIGTPERFLGWNQPELGRLVRREATPTGLAFHRTGDQEPFATALWQVTWTAPSMPIMATFFDASPQSNTTDLTFMPSAGPGCKVDVDGLLRDAQAMAFELTGNQTQALAVRAWVEPQLRKAMAGPDCGRGYLGWLYAPLRGPIRLEALERHRGDPAWSYDWNVGAVDLGELHVDADGGSRVRLLGSHSFPSEEEARQVARDELARKAWPAPDFTGATTQTSCDWG